MSVPGSKMADVDDDVGVHRAQRRQVELLVGNDAAAAPRPCSWPRRCRAPRAPIVGPRSASSTREPPSRPASSGTFGRLSYVNAPSSRLEPMLADSNTAFQRPPSLTSVPWVSNGGVVGSVMPSASPTADSDGPASLKRPFRPVKWSGSSVRAVEADAGPGR